MKDTTKKGILEKLDEGPVLGDGGYLLELEKRGRVRAGPFTPEVALENPEALLELHREFRDAGSEVLQSLTFYASRDKLATVGMGDRVEELNRAAVRIARQAAGNRCLVAGNISLTWLYEPNDKAAADRVRKTFDEQLDVQISEGVDFIIGETFGYTQEALLALDVIKQAGQVAVITLAAHKGRTREGWSWANAARRLEQAGADVVGLNCTRGPASMLPLLAEMRKAVKCHMAALPVPYRTTRSRPSFQSLTDYGCGCLPGGHAFPIALDPFTCNRFEIAEFGTAADGMGIHYLGVCCGAGPHHVRALAEAVGKRPAATRYSADMSKHYLFGHATLGKTSRQKAEDRRFAKAIVQT